MTPYASIADLTAAIPRGEAELVDLTDREGSGEMDPARVTRALEAATNKVNSYVGKVAALPLSIVPPLLRDHTATIARFELWGDAASEEVRKRYEDSMSWLRDLVAGRADLGVPSEDAPAPIARASRGKVKSGYDWDAYPAGGR